MKRLEAPDRLSELIVVKRLGADSSEETWGARQTVRADSSEETWG